MEIALSYLHQLWQSGYFSRPHKFDDGVWFESHPACVDGETWKRAKDYLVRNGYLIVKYLPESELKALNIHPKDELDTWWFEITDKGRLEAEKPNQSFKADALRARP